MTSSDERARRERSEKVAYWRYQLIRDAADPGLSPRARGRKVRELAQAVHPGPFGRQVRVSRPTLDRWIRAWWQGGFDALLPPRRQCTPRTPAEVLDLAAALKREQADRIARNVRTIEVLVDRDAVVSGAATNGQQWQHYDLGHGYC